MPEYLPLHDKVLLRRHIEKQHGSLLLPDRDRRLNASNFATVVAVGPGERCDVSAGDVRKPVGIQPGDVVVIPEDIGQSVRYGDETLIATFESSILGVLEDGEFPQPAPIGSAYGMASHEVEPDA